jgi:hypothetical protein
MASILIFASFVPASIAQTTALSYLYSGFRTQSYNATIVAAAAPSATAFALDCPNGMIPNCDGFPKVTLIFGSSSFSYDVSYSIKDFTFTQDCEVRPSRVVCKESSGGSAANAPGSSTETYAASDVGGYVFTVTKGADKSAAGVTAASTTGNAKTGSATSGPLASVTQASKTAVPSGSTTGSAPVAAASSGAAVGRSVTLSGGLFGVFAGILGGRLI